MKTKIWQETEGVDKPDFERQWWKRKPKKKKAVKKRMNSLTVERRYTDQRSAGASSNLASSANSSARFRMVGREGE